MSLSFEWKASQSLSAPGKKPSALGRGVVTCSSKLPLCRSTISPPCHYYHWTASRLSTSYTSSFRAAPLNYLPPHQPNIYIHLWTVPKSRCQSVSFDFFGILVPAACATTAEKICSNFLVNVAGEIH